MVMLNNRELAASAIGALNVTQVLDPNLFQLTTRKRILVQLLYYSLKVRFLVTHHIYSEESEVKRTKDNTIPHLVPYQAHVGNCT